MLRGRSRWLFRQPIEYCQIIAPLLNDSIHAKTVSEIPNPKTVKEMPDFGRQGIHPVKPLLSVPVSDLYSQLPQQAQAWWLTFFLHVHWG